MELDFFQAEHVVLLQLSQRLVTVLHGPPDAVLANGLRLSLDRILVSHLAKEDEHLYPLLKRHPATAAVAIRFEHELGGLAAAWRAFMTDWTLDRIAGDWAGFGAATHIVLMALAERARLEEDELYPLMSVDQQDAA